MAVFYLRIAGRYLRTERLFWKILGVLFKIRVLSMSGKLGKIRNIGIMAHIDAGKTTMTERVLYYTGKTYKMGEVHKGTAVMDFMEEEQNRGITITSAATRCPWKGYYMNLIDTPGHIDFTAEVERSLRVLDGAVAVFDGSEGVQAQSETVWRQGQKYNLACICFVNKMDKTGADFEMTIESIREKLLACPIVLQIPIGSGSTFSGIIDLLTMRAVFYKQEKLGATFEERDIPVSMQDEAERCRHDMLELAAEYDEEMMDAYVHDGPISVEVIKRAIRQGTLSNNLHPVFLGSALKYIGVQRVLDGIIAYLPSPLDRPDMVGWVPTFRGAAKHGSGSKSQEKKNKEVVVKCETRGGLVALAFKVTNDKHGDLHFLRIYRGILKSGSRVLNSTRSKRENITRIFEMHADERKILDSAGAGDIVATVGLKETLTGETICDPKQIVCLPSISFPECVVSMAIEPRTAVERAKLGEALSVLRREDPTFQFEVDRETGQMIIRGMGELHLEVLLHKLIREKGVDVRVGKPRVAYKETITRRAEAEGKFVRQTGGHGQYGHVVLTIEPMTAEDGHCSKEIEFENKIVGASVPKEYIPCIERSVRNALSSGALGSYPVVGVRVTLIDGSFHSVDSSELAFEQAAALAVQKVLKEAKSVLLEPVMRVQVVVPELSFGVVQSGLLSKRGTITDCRLRGNLRAIDAKVPLVEMFGYSSEIRSATAGRGSFTMEPLSYERMPELIAKQVLL